MIEKKSWKGNNGLLKWVKWSVIVSLERKEASEWSFKVWEKIELFNKQWNLQRMKEKLF